MRPTRVAARVGGCLAVVPGIDAAALFGSVARGDGDSRSDIDVLVVSGDPHLGPAAVRDQLPRRLRHPRLALLCLQPHRLRRMWQRGDAFAHHLFGEARILFDSDGELSTLMATAPPPPTDRSARLAAIRTQLRQFEDLSVFRGQFLFVLSSTYAWAKGVVVTDLIAAGSPTFNRLAAFERFRARHPDLADDVRAVADLEPFFAVVTRRLPVDAAPAADEARTRNAVEALGRICARLQEEVA